MDHKEDHEFELKKLARISLLNRLEAECIGIKRLIKSESSQISLIKHNTRLVEAESQLVSARQKSRLQDAAYRVNIELPAKLAAYKISKQCQADCDKVAAMTRVEEFCIKELGRAKIELDYGACIARARGIKKVALALREYYNALIIDRIACCILRCISSQFNLDRRFRFKLEWPLMVSRCPLENCKLSNRLRKRFKSLVHESE